MSHSKFYENALKIIQKHPQVFEALAEYDNTRKLPKTIYRERINLTINSTLLKQFKTYAKENNLNMSRVIEKHIKKELKLK